MTVSPGGSENRGNHAVGYPSGAGSKVSHAPARTRRLAVVLLALSGCRFETELRATRRRHSWPGRSASDGEESPDTGHTLQLEFATVLKYDPRSDHQRRDRA